ncbi:hypothetical protein [Haloarcula sp. H-GB5]
MSRSEHSTVNPDKQTYTEEQYQTIVDSAPACLSDPSEWADNRIAKFDEDPSCPECGMGPAGLRDVTGSGDWGQLKTWYCRHCENRFNAGRR